MSWTVAPMAAGAPHERPSALPAGPGAPSRTAVNAIIGLTTLLALALRVYLTARPGLLAVTQYDDGPYFGSAVRLVHGALPYRDFSFVQPPGITLLMAPVAAVSNVIGTAWGLVLARFVTVVAGTAAVPLAGLLVRHRGPAAVLLACGTLAVYPPSAAAAHTVLLEPWLVLACLAGALAVFDGDRLASPQRLAWGGAAFGVAGTVKIWAIVPATVLLALCLPQARKAAMFAAGTVAGFGAVALPFFVPAPGQFFSSVVTAQISRAGVPVPVWHRLRALLGLIPAPDGAHGQILLAVLAVAAFITFAQAAAVLDNWQAPPALDVFVTATLIGVAVMFLWPPYFADHYVAFATPFLGLALGLAATRLAPVLWPEAGGSPALRRAGWPVTALVMASFTAAAVAQALPGPAGTARQAAPQSVAAVIPPGACVLTDQASYLLLANRFTASAPGCPQLVDSLGTDLAISGGLRPGTGAGQVPQVETAWREAFHRAQYVLLSARSTRRIAWTSRLARYFHRNFRPVLRSDDFTVYRRRASRAR